MAILRNANPSLNIFLFFTPSSIFKGVKILLKILKTTEVGSWFLLAQW
jgi:hypothetical protein